MEVNTLCNALWGGGGGGGDPLQGPLEGAGPGNHDFLGPKMATSETHVQKFYQCSCFLYGSNPGRDMSRLLL